MEGVVGPREFQRKGISKTMLRTHALLTVVVLCFVASACVNFAWAQAPKPKADKPAAKKAEKAKPVEKKAKEAEAKPDAVK